MELITTICGDLKENCYTFSDSEKVGALVDPGGNAADILASIHDLRLDYIFVTHNHEDHIGALRELWDATRCSVVISIIDYETIRDLLPPEAWVLTEGGEVFPVGSYEVIVLPTPGHTLGSQSYLLNHEAVFTGDTLFATTIGRTENDAQHATLMESIREQLFLLPDATAVYPGHSGPTTIGQREKDFAEGKIVIAHPPLHKRV